MIRVGKALSWISILGYLVIASLASRVIREAVSANTTAILAINVVAGLAVLSSFLVWGMALYHWGTNENRRKSHKWGFRLILGAFVGAWVYWLRPWHSDDYVAMHKD